MTPPSNSPLGREWIYLIGCAVSVAVPYFCLRKFLGAPVKYSILLGVTVGVVFFVVAKIMEKSDTPSDFWDYYHLLGDKSPAHSQESRFDRLFVYIFGAGVCVGILYYCLRKLFEASQTVSLAVAIPLGIIDFLILADFMDNTPTPPGFWRD